MGKRSRTDFLVASPSFASGAARLLDFYGQFDSYNESDSTLDADYRAAVSDWNNVGQDLDDAISEQQATPA